MICDEKKYGRSDCQKKVLVYRQCGHSRSGCKREIAYCVDHGGDERAMREMQEHHEQVHNATEKG